MDWRPVPPLSDALRPGDVVQSHDAPQTLPTANFLERIAPGAFADFLRVERTTHDFNGRTAKGRARRN